MDPAPLAMIVVELPDSVLPTPAASTMLPPLVVERLTVCADTVPLTVKVPDTALSATLRVPPTVDAPNEAVRLSFMYAPLAPVVMGADTVNRGVATEIAVAGDVPPIDPVPLVCSTTEVPTTLQVVQEMVPVPLAVSVITPPLLGKKLVPTTPCRLMLKLLTPVPG